MYFLWWFQIFDISSCSKLSAWLNECRFYPRYLLDFKQTNETRMANRHIYCIDVYRHWTLQSKAEKYERFWNKSKENVKRMGVPCANITWEKWNIMFNVQCSMSIRYSWYCTIGRNNKTKRMWWTTRRKMLRIRPSKQKKHFNEILSEYECFHDKLHICNGIGLLKPK